MKKNRVIQFSLVIVAIILFFFTYYSKERKKIIGADKNTPIEEVSKLTEKISNVLENVNYNGSDGQGTFFDLNASLAEIPIDKPNLSYMKVVNAVIRVKNGREIYIKSDFCVYDRSTNDAKFTGNILVTEANNQITSDNLDLIMSNNLITIYNNVKYKGEKGFLIADKVDIDILKNESNIFMFDKKDKIQAKYKN